MSVESVKNYLKKWNVEERVKEFSESSATVELAAKAVGVIPARIAKTLSFLTKEGCILVVAAGDAKIDNAKYKSAFGEKAKMLSFEQVEDMTGHPVGGVCPFANKEGVKTYLDASMKRFKTIFPAAGSASSAIELTCEELFEIAKAQSWVDVCKGWEEAVSES